VEVVVVDELGEVVVVVVLVDGVVVVVGGGAMATVMSTGLPGGTKVPAGGLDLVITPGEYWLVGSLVMFPMIKLAAFRRLPA
jgi:hypothetical protein